MTRVVATVLCLGVAACAVWPDLGFGLAARPHDRNEEYLRRLEARFPVGMQARQVEKDLRTQGFEIDTPRSHSYCMTDSLVRGELRAVDGNRLEMPPQIAAERCAVKVWTVKEVTTHSMLVRFAIDEGGRLTRIRGSYEVGIM